MVIKIDQNLRNKLRSYYKTCSICGGDVFASDDFVYTESKQNKTIVHKKCYESLIRRGKKND